MVPFSMAYNGAISIYWRVSCLQRRRHVRTKMSENIFRGILNMRNSMSDCVVNVDNIYVFKACLDRFFNNIFHIVCLF